MLWAVPSQTPCQYDKLRQHQTRTLLLPTGTGTHPLAMALRRINREWLENERDPIPGITITLDNPGDITVWNVVLEGPVDTPYEGGVFRAQVRFPRDYPFKPPQFALTTKIYSPHAHGG